MKKTIFFVFGALTLSCAEAKADKYNYVPYIGTSYSYSVAKVDTAKPHYNIGGVYIGSEYGKYFATEIFYNQSTYGKKYINNIQTRTSYRAYGLDLVAYLPLDCDNRFDLAATIGAGEYVFAKKIKGDKHHDDSGWGYRFGGGMKYNITQNWQAKIMIRYINFDGISDFDRQTEYSLGAEYHF